MSNALAGFLIALGGLVLRYWAFDHLTRAGLDRAHVEQVLPPPSWAKGGPYRLANHPAYWGSLAMLAGIGIAALGWAGWVLCLPVVPFLYERAMREDRMRRSLPRGIQGLPEVRRRPRPPHAA